MLIVGTIFGSSAWHYYGRNNCMQAYLCKRNLQRKSLERSQKSVLGIIWTKRTSTRRLVLQDLYRTSLGHYVLLGMKKLDPCTIWHFKWNIPKSYFWDLGIGFYIAKSSSTKNLFNFLTSPPHLRLRKHQILIHGRCHDFVNCPLRGLSRLQTENKNDFIPWNKFLTRPWFWIRKFEAQIKPFSTKTAQAYPHISLMASMFVYMT